MTEQLGTTVSRLPVLPLRGLVAFPNMIIHFDVGRLLSIRALEAAMKNGQTLFLTAQRDLKTDNPSPSDLYQIGTICQVKQILRLPGDNIRVLVEGKQRALVHPGVPNLLGGVLNLIHEVRHPLVEGVEAVAEPGQPRKGVLRLCEQPGGTVGIVPAVETFHSCFHAVAQLFGVLQNLPPIF